MIGEQLSTSNAGRKELKCQKRWLDVFMSLCSVNVCPSISFFCALYKCFSLLLLTITHALSLCICACKPNATLCCNQLFLTSKLICLQAEKSQTTSRMEQNEENKGSCQRKTETAVTNLWFSGFKGTGIGRGSFGGTSKVMNAPPPQTSFGATSGTRIGGKFIYSLPTVLLFLD